MNPALQLLGLVRRARRLAAGHEAVERALDEGRAALVLLATDAGASTRRRFAARAAERGVPVRVWGRSEELGRATGLAPKAVLAVCDRRLAERLLELLDGSPGGAPGSPSPRG